MLERPLCPITLAPVSHHAEESRDEKKDDDTPASSQAVGAPIQGNRAANGGKYDKRRPLHVARRISGKSGTPRRERENRAGG